jgi:hypothetical protein
MDKSKELIPKKKWASKKYKGWIDSYMKPKGTFWKRQFNKQVRQSKDYTNNIFFK